VSQHTLRTRTVLAASAVALLGGGAAVALAADPGTPAQGSPGSLVASFGNAAPPQSAGLVLAPGNIRLRAVAFQADGKVVATGQDGTGNSARLAVVRYTQAGQLDGTFGDGGVVLAPRPLTGAESAASASFGTSIVVQPDQRVLVGGTLRSGSTTKGMVAMRLQPTGAPDTSFDGDGIASALTGTDRNGEANGIALDPSGRPILAGTATEPGGAPRWATVVRLTTAGTADGSYGNGGVQQLVGIGKSSGLDSIAAQTDGKVVVGGVVFDDFGASLSLGYRVNADGTRDGAFGGGFIINQFANDGAYSHFQSVSVDPSGRVVYAGPAARKTTGDGFVARYTPSGSPDSSFGDGGVTRLAAGGVNESVLANPRPGFYGVAATAGNVYAGGGVEARGNYRILAMTGLSASNGRPRSDFGAAIGSEFEGQFGFTSDSGTTYTFVNGRTSNPFSGPTGQTAGVAVSADRTLVAAVGIVDQQVGGGLEPASARGFVALYKAASEPPPVTPTPTPTPPATTPTTPTGTTPTPTTTVPPTTTTPTTVPTPAPTATPTPTPTATPAPPAKRRVSALKTTARVLGPRTKATVSYRLSRAGSVSVRVQQKRTGRRTVSGGKTTCKKASFANVGGARCSYYTRLAQRRTLKGKAGTNRFTLQRRFAGRTLTKGSYRLELVPTGGSAAFLGFRVG